ncbi:nucleoside-diphosphate kinase [Pseudomonas fluorescens]|uniref:nucleoside-diphosphate kinase n=1 Tax=Pseudomonas fluorescens TaxID=294 RepID=UPI001131F2C7|nr:nucleoside-diphosphate kinase [Pseudomonas fluorescens]TMU75619.1 nucleoside-diphosphate kinase [Pseudomonas fluorescens]
MSRNRTFILVKPDAVHRGLVGNIVSRFESCGFKFVAMKMIQMTDDIFYGLYPSIKGKVFHDQFYALMNSGPSVALVLEGHQAVKSAFDISGPSRSPELDTTNSIRKSFALWTGADVIHRADSVEDANAQIELVFTPQELFSYYKLGEEFTSQEAWDAYGSRWS